MIRRRSLKTNIHHERWLISYSDFITLLFAFFVVMYSVSQMNEGNYKDLAETLQRAFSLAELDENLADGEQLNKMELVEQQEIIEPQELRESLQQQFAELSKHGTLTVSGNEDWVEIDINSEILFASGDAKLTPEALTIFRDIAAVFAPYDNAVTVSGHTDDVPIYNQRFRSNWELSSARAVSVVDVLAANGVLPQRLSAVAYGEHQPIASNDTEQGREKNRRVVLRVLREAAAVPKNTTQDLLTEDSFAAPSDQSDSVQVNNAQVDSETQTTAGGDTNVTPESRIEPIQLRDGGLLFTRDPDSPRNSR